jgi:hypothetical protein
MPESGLYSKRAGMVSGRTPLRALLDRSAHETSALSCLIGLGSRFSWTAFRDFMDAPYIKVIFNRFKRGFQEILIFTGLM